MKKVFAKFDFNQFIENYKVIIFLVALLISGVFIHVLSPVVNDVPEINTIKELNYIISFLLEEHKLSIIYLETKYRDYLTEDSKLYILQKTDEKYLQELEYFHSLANLYIKRNKTIIEQYSLKEKLSDLEEIRSLIKGKKLNITDVSKYYINLLYEKDKGFLDLLYNYSSEKIKGKSYNKIFDIVSLSYALVYLTMIRDYGYIGLRYDYFKNDSYNVVYLLSLIKSFNNSLELKDKVFKQKLSKILETEQFEKLEYFFELIGKGNTSYDYYEFFRVCSEVSKILSKFLELEFKETVDYAYSDFSSSLIRYVILVILLTLLMISPPLLIFRIQKKNVYNVEKSLNNFLESIEDIFSGRNIKDEVEIYGSAELKEKLLKYYNIMKHKALENMRLISDIQKELDIASKIQKNIMQNRVIRWRDFIITGYSQPLGKVGGDFFDIININDEKLLFYIADVSGHGIPAAFITNMLKMSIIDIIYEEKEPHRILEELNKRISIVNSDNSDIMHYLTIFLGIIESDKKSNFIMSTTENAFLSYSVGGHSLPLFYSFSKKQFVDIPNTKGSVIGFMDPDIYSATKESTKIEEGDILVLYTDGITERRNPKGEEFGLERLKNVISKAIRMKLSNKKLLSYILIEIEKFSDKTPPKDDYTILIIEKPTKTQSVLSSLPE